MLQHPSGNHKARLRRLDAGAERGEVAATALRGPIYALAIFSAGLEPTRDILSSPILPRSIVRSPTLTQRELSMLSLPTLSANVISWLTTLAESGHPKFDVAFRDHFFDTLYNADGTRTEKTIDDLLPAADVRFNRMYAAGIAKKCDDQSLPDCIRKGIAACGNDVAALNILLSRPEKFLFGGDCNLRSPDAVEKRVRDLVANLKELRNATKDKGLRESGEIMLLGLAGKSLPPGSIATMVEATKAIVPTALLSIRADSAAAAIHKAVREALATMEKVLEKAGITGKLLFDHDDATAYRRFVIRNILAHLDEQTLRAFARALSSGEAVTLNVLYNDFSASRYDIDEKHIVNEVERRASTYADVLLKLKTVTDEALGMPMETIPLEGDAIDPDKPIVGTVYRDLVKDAKGRAQAGNADAPQAGNRT